MERKRKLPARAAARVEQAAKKRNMTPRERSVTPAPVQSPVPVVEEPPPPPPLPPLPRSLQPGKPLPLVEDAQPEDLSAMDFQSFHESGVLAESLSRSRHKWVSEGLFEKYWSKPHKRKGVIHEDPKNPPKDTMAKVGTVIVTIEPHVIEATMFAVKDPKRQQPPQPVQPPQASAPASTPVSTPASAQPRPILQYGPPNGSMPPPPTPSPAPATPTAVPAMPATAPVTPQAATPSPIQAHSQPSPALLQAQPVPPRDSPQAAVSRPVVAPPPPTQTYSPAPGAARSSTSASPAPAPRFSPAAAMSNPVGPVTTAAPGALPASRPSSSQAPAQSPRPVKPGTPAGAAPAARPAANDPVIALLAQKASGDAELRDLMKRVAVGQAKDGELAHFQKIIDNLNAEYKRKGGQQGPSADRLLVDGKTVKYFADEVRTILDIVLASNPHQKSSELRPPPRSDPLVVLLVKTALEDQRTKDMIRRIAEGRPGFTDATDLKEILDRLHRDAKTVPQISPAASMARPAVPNGLPNGNTKAQMAQSGNHPNPQALRSKGPPPISRPDVSAVVFDFGSGDRYLFPKYSILEYLPAPSGQQVVASFLIVRKGSTSEYGGDPTLDYYQPVTIRLHTNSGRHLENLARVVAPQDEVRRYMDDVMDNMTRAEYVLLAMRLPRFLKDSDKEDGGSEEPMTNGSTPKAAPEPEPIAAPKLSVLWTPQTSDAVSAAEELRQVKPQDPEEETQLRYQRLIQSVTARGLDAV